METETIMETINHECYVSLEVAKLLKEAGFDWECKMIHFCYVEDDYMWNLEDNNKKARSILKLDYCLLAPTLEVAQRWLREEKGIYIGITAIENKRAVTNSDGWTFHYEYGKPKFDCYIQDERCENMCTLYDSFDTYEEALEVGIKKSLENIL